jgi:hypothetical protein
MAQVYDPADLAINKFRYDLEYLARLSPWLDAKLIVLSVVNSLGARWDHRTGKPQDETETRAYSDSDQRHDELVDEPVYRH